MFLSPIWLVALIPLAMLTIWMLRGTSTSTSVPFLKLWPAQGAMRSDQRRFRLPALPILLILCAILLAILAAAGPVWRSSTVPEKPLVNRAGLTLLAAEGAPHPQVMARIVNHQPAAAQATLKITSGESSAEQSIDLPPASSTNTFVDLPKFDSTIQAELILPDDDIPADNRASLTRLVTDLPIALPNGSSPEFAKLLQVYAQHRPGVRPVVESLIDPTSPHVVVSPASQTFDISDAIIVPHEITSDLRWNMILADARRTDASPPTGWRSLLRVGDHTLLAIREFPTRAVWVGFDSPTFSKNANYVVFWSGVFDWAGRADREHYGNFSAGSPDLGGPEPSKTRPQATRERALGPFLLVAVLLVLCAAAVTWQRFSLTAISNPRTVLDRMG